MALPFEQLPKESNKAFEAFGLYLNMGPERSLADVAGKLGKSKTLMERWSARYDWPDRVQAHGAHLALAEREASEALARSKGAEWIKRQEQHREEEWKVRGELLVMAREAIERWKRRPERCGSLEGIARLLELASKLGRLSSGMATDRTEVSEDVSVTVDLEFEAALKKAYGVFADCHNEPAPIPVSGPKTEVIDAELVEQKVIGGKL